jgi:hypothetical protein
MGGFALGNWLTDEMGEVYAHRQDRRMHSDMYFHYIRVACIIAKTELDAQPFDDVIYYKPCVPRRGIVSDGASHLPGPHTIHPQ